MENPEPYAMFPIPDGTPDERADFVLQFLDLLKFNTKALNERFVCVSNDGWEEEMEEIIEDAVLSLTEQGYYGTIENGKLLIYKQKPAT